MSKVEKRKTEILTENVNGIDFKIPRWLVQLYGNSILGLKHILAQKIIDDQLQGLKTSDLKSMFNKLLINGPVLGVKNKHLKKLETDTQKYREILSIMFIKLVVDKVTAQYNLSFINE